MEYAIQIVAPYEELSAAAHFSEARGLPALAVPDHYLYGHDPAQAATRPAPDVFVQLGALARETTDLELVLLVSPVTFRHPAVLLKMGIELDLLSGGRFTLGLGTGWMEAEHEVFGFPFPPLAERFEMLEEAVAYIRAGLADPPTGFEGRHFRLLPWPIRPRARRLRLLVGGIGPRRTPSIAGRYADEFNAFHGPGLADRIAVARAAAVEAGRDPDALLVSSVTWVVAAPDRADLERRLDRIAARQGRRRDELDRLLEARRAIVGTFDEVRARLAELEALGVRRFYLQGGFDPELTPELLDVLEG